MQITNNTFTEESELEIYKYYQEKLNELTNTNFKIKQDGLLDFLIKFAIEEELNLAKLIKDLEKQYNPEETENYWLSTISARMGLFRKNAGRTIFKKEITGKPNFKGNANSITIRNKTSNAEFINASDFTLNEEGKSNVEFKALDFGKIEVNENDNFVIVEAPNEISEISTKPAENVTLGELEENDEDFYDRYSKSKSINANSTQEANLANLKKFVVTPDLLSIHSPNNNSSINNGEILVIAKPNISGEKFAQAIFDNIMCGTKTLGDISYEVTDALGKPATIKFQNAIPAKLALKLQIKLKPDIDITNLKTELKQNILEYIKEKFYKLNTIIYATELTIPIIETDGVLLLNEIEISKASENAEYQSFVELEINEFPSIDDINIELINLTTEGIQN